LGKGGGRRKEQNFRLNCDLQLTLKYQKYSEIEGTPTLFERKRVWNNDWKIRKLTLQYNCKCWRTPIYFVLSIVLARKWETHRIKKNIVSPRRNSIQLKTNLTYMECKCYKKNPIWIVFIHYLTPRKLRKDLKGKQRENENSTEMESVYLLLFVSTNHRYLIFFGCLKKLNHFLPLSLHISLHGHQYFFLSLFVKSASIPIPDIFNLVTVSSVSKNYFKLPLNENFVL